MKGSQLHDSHQSCELHRPAVAVVPACTHQLLISSSCWCSMLAMHGAASMPVADIHSADPDAFNIGQTLQSTSGHAWTHPHTVVLKLVQSQCIDVLLKICRRAGLRVAQTCRPSTMDTLSAGGVPGAADGPARDWPVQPHNRAQSGAPGHTCAAGGVPCPLQVPLQSLWAAKCINARPEGLGRKPGSPECLSSGSGQRAPAQQARGLHLLERGSWRGLRAGPMH